MTPTVLDLFCGAAGGWSLGLHRAGFTTIAACEVDPWRRAQFIRNFPGVVMYDDVRALTAGRLRADGFAPDIIVGSPPCQDASSANAKGKGVDGERTGLFFEAVRLVRELRPRWCAFENVPGIRTRGIDRVLSDLGEARYTCWPLVVGACDFGANHRRKRLVLLAADADANALRIEPRGRCGTYWTETAIPLVDGAPDPDKARLAIREGVTGDNGAQRPAAERDRSPPRHHWGATAPDFDRVDDGLSDAMARACISAYGDAFLPQIAEAAGRAILACGGFHEQP